MANVLVYDLGIGVEHARRLGADGHNVYYYNKWESPFPSYRDYVIGMGFPEIQKVMSPWEVIDKVEYVFFPDTSDPALVEYLRSIGKYVFGAGKGDILESNRVFAKKFFDKAGIKYPESRTIIGINNVKKFLEENKDQAYVIKLNRFRGDLETRFSHNEAEGDSGLDVLAERIGPFQDQYEFSIETAMSDTIECGFDLFFNGEDFVKPYLWGFEHYANYVGKWTNEMPPILQDIADKFVPFLQSVGYRGAFSSEGLLKDGVFYFIDVTSRMAFSLSYLYPTVIKNYSDLILSIARGESIDIEVDNEYVTVLNLRSNSGVNHFEVIGNPDNLSNIKYYRAAKVGDNIYNVPAEDLIASIITSANDYQTAIAKSIEDINKVFINNGTFNEGLLKTMEDNYIIPIKEKENIVF